MRTVAWATLGWVCLCLAVSAPGRRGTAAEESIAGVDQTLLPDKDATIHSQAPEPRGERPDLWVGMEPGGAKEFRSLIHFDLGTLKKQPVRSAILRLCCSSANSGKKHILFVRVHPLYRDWDEKTVVWRSCSATETWFNPGGDFLPKACAAVDLPKDVSGDENKWYSFDVTATVQQWQNGTLKNHGLILMNEQGSDTDQYYYAREADKNRPQLLVSYTQPIVTPDARPKDVSTLTEYGPVPQLAPKIASPGLKPGVLNQPYSFQLVAVGGEGPYKWELVGLAPPGFQLSSDGLLTGTPGKLGALALRFKVQGSDRQSSLANFKLEILATDPHAGMAGSPGPGPGQAPPAPPAAGEKPADSNQPKSPATPKDDG